MTTPTAPLLRTLGFLALIGLASIATAAASPLTGTLAENEYVTSGNVDDYSANPAGTIEFIGISQSALLTPGAISLGEFASQPLTQGTGPTYHDMPFSITMSTIQGSGSSQPVAALLIQGVLNGTVTGSTQSDVTATITSVGQDGTMPLPYPLASFQIDAPQLLAAPGINGGLTSLIAYISAPTPSIPEPASWAVFALALVVGLQWLRGTR